MGQGRPSGTDVGAARGSIVIDVSQVETARSLVRKYATDLGHDFDIVDKSVRRAEASIKAANSAVQSLNRTGGLSFARGAVGAALGNIGGPIGAIAGAAGSGNLAIAAGVGAVEAGKAAVAAANVAVAYERQNTIAAQLAGNQERLNTMVRAFQEASGGAVDEAAALANVLTLLSTGLAKTPEQMEKFARAARGISIAKPNLTTANIVQQLGLESLNQTGQRLDQLGLDYQEVRRRAAELRAENAALSKEQAYQNAILDVADQKYGKLAESAAGGATGTERMATAGRDLQLAIGQLIGPLVNFGANLLADDMEREVARWKAWKDIILEVADALNLLPTTGPITARTGIGSNIREKPQAFDRFSPEQEEAILRRNEAQQDITERANEQIADATEQYEKQRADTIANYEKQIAREAEDWGRQRAQAERDLQERIAEVHEDSARQQERWARDLAQTIADAQSDSAERVAQLVADRNDRVAELREDAAKRLEEIEEDYQKSSEEAAEQHRLTLLEAGGRLDAKAIYQEEQRFKLEEKKRLEAAEEAKKKLQEQLDERIDEEDEAHKKQLDAEAKALQKSIDQANKAHQQRLNDAVENDNQRIQDMKDAFEKEKTQAETERGIRLERQAQDHSDQLTAMDTAHQDRIAQIGDHAQQERDKVDEEFGKSLEALGIHVDGFTKEAERAVDAAIEEYDRWLAHMKAGFKNREELEAERNQIVAQLKGIPAGTPEWQRLQDRIVAIDRELNEGTGGVSAAGGFGGMSPSMMGAGSIAPIPMGIASAGMGGGRSLTIGSINPTIVIGDTGGRSDAYIMGLVRQGLVEALTEVAG